MSYRSIHRYARIAPRKARLIADMIRGQRIDEALTALEFSHKRAAYFFRNVLKSAVANAEEADADMGSLYVAESRVDEGPVIKRWRPKDRGRSHPYKKRTSHLHVLVAPRSR
jgi:large subunit ribosomal protein L22